MSLCISPERADLFFGGTESAADLLFPVSLYLFLAVSGLSPHIAYAAVGFFDKTWSRGINAVEVILILPNRRFKLKIHIIHGFFKSMRNLLVQAAL